MTAQEKITKILQQLKDGKILYFSTSLRVIKVKQKDVDKFEAIGRALFKASNNSMFISSGKKYVCIDYCQITVEG